MRQTSPTLALCALIIGFFLTINAVAVQTDITGPAGSGAFGSNVVVLPNGNIVVVDSTYDLSGPTVSDVGAVYLYDGATLALISTITGSTASDQIGGGGITVLTNGNYVVRSPNWDNPSPLITNVGAVTWGNGLGGTVGVVTALNSLIGGTASDFVGNNGVTALPNGNYVVFSASWDNPSPVVANASAYTFGNGASGTSGLLTNGASGGNSVVGTVASGTNTFAFDATRNRLFVGRQASNIVSVLFFNTTAIADGDLGSPGNWDNGVPNGLLTGIIPSGRTMSISSIMNIGQIQVQCGGNLMGGGASAYIVGSVRRDFCAASGASFNFPIGDANNYSPLNATNTNGTGALTAAVTDNFMPGLPQALSISRLWSLTGAGITTDLTFNYVNADVNGTEADYRLFKRNANNNLTVPISPSVVNAAANTITTINVSNFSDWSAGNAPVAVLAAGVTVSGRVMTKEGNGIRNAIVSLTDANGITRYVRTSSFGYYTFDDVEAGATYTVAVQSKRFTFTMQVVSVNDNIADLDFTAQ